jgi:hypothetical protein
MKTVYAPELARDVLATLSASPLLSLAVAVLAYAVAAFVLRDA